MPIGLGLSGERVEKTPVIAALALFRGRVVKMVLSALCNQVNNIISSPGLMFLTASRNSSKISIAASGAFSCSSNGQSSRRLSSECTLPINLR